MELKHNLTWSVGKLLDADHAAVGEVLEGGKLGVGDGMEREEGGEYVGFVCWDVLPWWHGVLGF